MRSPLTAVLRRALESARDALARLDADQVPAALRRVVAASGLTPDLEARLLRELEALPWLREKAAARWKGAEAALEGDGPDRASALFLLRPAGWEMELARLAGEAGAASGSVSADKDATALLRARADAEAAKEKLKQVTRELQETRSEQRRVQKEAAGPGRVEGAAATRERERSAATEARLRNDLQTSEEKLAETKSALVAARDEARRLRQDLARSERQREEARPVAGWGRDAAGLARALDDLATAAERVVPDLGAPPDARPRRLPEGMLPDSAEAMRWVLDLPQAKHIVIDGYNLGLALGAGDAAAVRARLEPVLGRIRTVARPPRIVTAVYDSAIAGSRTAGAAGVMIRYADPGVSADDVIVSMAHPGTVVISNDREVRERSTAAGALALWSDAAVKWARKRA